MKVKLLRRLRKNYSVIKLVDPTISLTHPIYRLLCRGVIVPYAWVYAEGERSWRDLIIALAYDKKWVRATGRSDMMFRMDNVLDRGRAHRKSLRLNRTRDKIISKTAPVWPS